LPPAGDDLNIAQQAVSQQIQALERALGVTLLRRTSRHVELTAEGAKLLEGARRVLAAADNASTRSQSRGTGVRLARYVWPTRTARHGRQSRGFWHTLASVARGSASNRARLWGVRSGSSFCPIVSIWQSPQGPRTRGASTRESCGASRWELPSAEQTGSQGASESNSQRSPTDCLRSGPAKWPLACSTPSSLLPRCRLRAQDR